MLLEVADGVVVSVGKEIHDVRGGFDVVLEVRHEVCAVAFDLLIGRDGAEDYFGKSTAVEGAVSYPSHDFERVFDNRDGEMGFVIDEAGNIVFGHLGELLLEDAFQACEDDIAFSRIVVVNHAKLDYAILLLNHGRLLGKGDDFGRGECRGIELGVGQVSFILLPHSPTKVMAEVHTSSRFGLTPFCSGEFVRAFLDRTEVNASSDAFRLSGSRKLVPSALNSW